MKGTTPAALVVPAMPGVIGIRNPIPGWVYAKYGALAKNVLFTADDTLGRYYDGMSGKRRELPETAYFSLTRASSATNLRSSDAAGAAYSTFGSGVPVIVSGDGRFVYEARTNYLLNSTAPATQTTVSLATGFYTLWVNGSGSSAVSAGTATITGAGTATNGSPDTFEVTGAGTATVTVTGSLNAFQLENGSFPTTLIVTTGTTAARAADVTELIGPAATAALAAKGAYFETDGVAGGINNEIASDALGATRYAFFVNNSTTARISNGTDNADATLGSGDYTGVVKIASSFNSSMSIVANGGTKATSANAFSISGDIYYGNRAAGDRALNGLARRMAFFDVDPTDAGLTA